MDIDLTLGSSKNSPYDLYNYTPDGQMKTNVTHLRNIYIFALSND
jgi:hypothetical protein